VTLRLCSCPPGCGANGGLGVSWIGAAGEVGTDGVDDDHLDLVGRTEFLECLTDRPRHVGGHGIAAVRAIEGDAADQTARIGADEDVRGHAGIAAA